MNYGARFMCAIAGLIHCGEPALLDAMMRVQSHRGPESHGQNWFEPFASGLGHCRLAFLDLSPAGHQPMATPDERYWIAFNGEVYSFADIRSELAGVGVTFRSRSDTEVVLRAYELWGVDCLKRFNGTSFCGTRPYRDQTLLLLAQRRALCVRL